MKDPGGSGGYPFVKDPGVAGHHLIKDPGVLG